MNRSLSTIFIIIIILALIAILCAFFFLPSPGKNTAEPAVDGETAAETEAAEPGLTVVSAPEQTKAQRPPCFPDPEANYIPMPETENLAQGKPVQSGEHTDVYVIENINDGSTESYWESKGFPAEVTVELGGSHAIGTVAVRLNPSAIWEARQQEIAVWISTDGENYTEIAPAAMYDFDPNTGNRIRIDFEAADASFVKVVFTKNTSSHTGGAQVAELEIYG